MRGDGPPRRRDYASEKGGRGRAGPGAATSCRAALTLGGFAVLGFLFVHVLVSSWPRGRRASYKPADAGALPAVRQLRAPESDLGGSRPFLGDMVRDGANAGGRGAVVAREGPRTRDVVVIVPGSEGDTSGFRGRTRGTLAPTPLGNACSPRVTLFLAVDTRGQFLYKQHLRALRCYARRHGHALVVDDMTSGRYPAFDGVENLFFRRHCLLAERMAQQQPGSQDDRCDWTLALDADTIVVDAATSVPAWVARTGIPDWADIVHFERMHNREVPAGYYLVRNTARARRYLAAWVALEAELEPRNADQGPLHVLVARTLFGASSAEAAAVTRAHNSEAYEFGGMLAAFWCAMGPRRHWPEAGVAIVRRAHFVARDFFVLCPADPATDGDARANLGGHLPGEPSFLVHGWKESLGDWYAGDYAAELERCEDDDASAAQWSPALRPERVLDKQRALAALQSRDAFSVSQRPVGVTDISECWPTCDPAGLSPDQHAKLEEALCRDLPPEFSVRHGASGILPVASNVALSM